MTKLKLPLVLDDCGNICVNPDDRQGRMFVSPALVYYTEAVARSVLRSGGMGWENSQYQKNAQNEGWDIFNLSANGNWLDAGIERDDEVGIFEDDDAAVAHVQERALAGSQGHANAIIIEHACNSLRYWTWGATWVTSRIGPEQC